MKSMGTQKAKAFNCAKSISSARPELMRKIRGVINRALETGASFEEVKKEIARFVSAP